MFTYQSSSKNVWNVYLSYWNLSHVLTNDFENFIIRSGKICLLYENQTGIGITEYVRFFLKHFGKHTVCAQCQFIENNNNQVEWTLERSVQHGETY